MTPLGPLAVLMLSQTVPVDVLDIRKASAGQVEAVKSAVPAGGWWVEAGNEFVVANAPVGVAWPVPALRRFDAVDPERLVVVGRGCAEPVEAGTYIAGTGRWQLRMLGPDEARPLPDAHVTVRPHRNNVSWARRYALDAPVARVPDPAIQQVVDAVDPARWFADVTAIAAFDRSSYATTSLAAARDLIAARMQQQGLDTSTPGFSMPGPGGTITRQNVLGRWTGTTMPDEWIVVGAHYDSRNANAGSTVNTPGAEDNASGCAGVLELARVLVPANPSRSILFLCYAGEEQGLHGSAAHVQSLVAANDLPRVQAVVIMDMIGYSADANLQVLYESEPEFLTYLQQFGAAAATYAPQLDVVYSTNPFGSDHMPYLDAGVRTLLAIENDWATYPHYHRSTDTPANMGPNAQAMGGAILKVNAAMLAELAGVHLPGVFADGFE